MKGNLTGKSLVLVTLIAVVSVCAILIGRTPLGRSTHSLQLKPEIVELQDYPIGEKSIHMLEVINPNSFPIHIIGIGGSNCAPGGCVKPVDFRPIELGARQTATLAVEFSSHNKPGPIENSLPIYYSSDRVWSKEIRIVGKTVEKVTESE